MLYDSQTGILLAIYNFTDQYIPLTTSMRESIVGGIGYWGFREKPRELVLIDTNIQFSRPVIGLTNNTVSTHGEREGNTTTYTTYNVSTRNDNSSQYRDVVGEIYRYILIIILLSLLGYIGYLLKKRMGG
jgi:hypothetical protein